MEGAIDSLLTGVQPVLNAVARTAARLCDANDASIILVEGDRARLASWHGTLRHGRRLGEAYALSHDMVSDRAIVERRTIHVRDLAKTARTQFLESKARQLPLGVRTILATPLLRGGVAIGVIVIRRKRVRPFTARQIALLKIFADQAAIAIENAQLSRELEARNRDLTEALEQQTATAEILRAISSSPTDIRPILETVVRSAARFCGAPDVGLLRLDGAVLRGAAAVGPFGDRMKSRIGGLDGLEVAVTRGSVSGRAVSERRIVHVHDLAAEPEDEFPVGRALQLQFGHRTMVAAPLLREGTPLGVMMLFRTEVNPFSEKQLELLRIFADQAVIAIENTRLFKELEARNRELTVALEQQTATSEILRVISSSPTDVQPVFDTIVRSAVKLCDGLFSALFQFDGELIHQVAQHNYTPEALEEVRRAYPRRPSRARGSGRAILERAVVHMPDVEVDPEYEHSELARVIGFRSGLWVPMLREGTPIGVIAVTRAAPGPFSDNEIDLLKTFADQAVIAIENVRLFKELEARNRDLTEALEQQTATSEILRVISGSPTDVQPVFEAIAESAARLCGGMFGYVVHFDGELMHLAASHNMTGDRVQALRDVFPTRPNRGHVSGRAILNRAVVHISDLLEDRYARPTAEATGMRSMVSVPMLRDGDAIGVINVARAEPQPFTDNQIKLLQTFARQAVIAIENVRLFKELEARNRELTVALEQQTATSEILRVISRSPTDVQPVFATIARNAGRLCDGVFSLVTWFDGELVHIGALDMAEGYADVPTPWAGLYPRPPQRTGMTGQAMLERAVFHVTDVENDPRVSPANLHFARLGRYRSFLVVPMLRGSDAVGTINVARPEAGPFPTAQIELLKTFADQAVIAIENVRLFKELEARNRDLSEALEQQTATSAILRVISESPTDTQPVFDAIADRALRLCGASVGGVLMFDGELLHIVARANFDAESPIARAFPMRPSYGGSASARAILTRQIVHLPDVLADPTYDQPQPAAVSGFRAALAVPMLRDEKPVGCITVGRPQAGAYSERQIALLQTFADQAVIAIENVRLFKELEARNKDLTVALEQQTATSEILRVISRSQTDVQPVFDTIVRSAVRLCDGLFSGLYQFDGELIHQVAHHNYTPEALEEVHRIFPARPTRGLGVGRAILERAAVHILDVEVDPEFRIQALTRAIGMRSGLFVPMLREGAPIGVIAVARAEPGPFSDNEIELLKTFADQAVIAVENVRLFKELQTRTGELTHSVEKLTALGEVSRAVGSTLDVETVLDTIVSRASQLAGADGCTIYEYDEAAEQFELRATHNVDVEFVEAIRAMPLRKGEGLMGRAAELREPVQIPDITQPGVYQSSIRDTLLRFGYRALLSVPLLREDHIIGSLSLNRKAPGEFPPEVIDVLKNFATQSALAIQNARLFREIEAKSRQLEVASRHKSDFLANVSHELRTPMNAILGFNEMILGGIYGDVPEGLKVPLTDIQNSGNHLLRLINNVLDLSKIEAGRMELALADYSVHDTVESVRASLRSLASEKGLDFVTAVPEDIPLARGDAGRIVQCLMNLAGNALKFTRQGRVAISVELRDDVLYYRVADTGIGIAKDQLETVFGEFRQGDPTVSSEFGGTGLGLSITKKFIEMHGGRLWVESDLGKGSTFGFAIPLRVELAKTG